MVSDISLTCCLPRPTSSPTLLKAVVYGGRCSIMNYSIYPHKIDTHSKSNCSEYYSYKSISLFHAVENNFLVMGWDVGMVHTKKSIAANFRSIRGEITFLNEGKIKRRHTNLNTHSGTYNKQLHMTSVAYCGKVHLQLVWHRCQCLSMEEPCNMCLAVVEKPTQICTQTSPVSGTHQVTLFCDCGSYS
jgi:hypothetical protein